MFARLILAAFCFLFTAVQVQSAVLPVPDETTGRLAPRAFFSGGLGCWYRCPVVDGVSSYSAYSAFSRKECSYMSTSGVYFRCDYDYNAGTVSRSSDPACPPRAPFTCKSEPAVFGEWRRQHRPVTQAEKVIKDRQYRPQKVVASA